MKQLLPISLAILLLLTACSKDLGLDVISFNIRYDNPGDGINAWPNRNELVVEFLKDQHPDIFGLQEALWHQYSFIDSSLTDYSSVGVGRSDGIKEGEMTPVFFDRERFKLLDYDTFWLSETPDIAGSRGWGAVLPRIVTWIKLFDNISREEFYYFNTHYSHMSDSARLMSSHILAEQVFRIVQDNYFVITGDFNMSPESMAYSVLTNSNDKLIFDTYNGSLSDPTGPDYTFNGFRDISEGSRIDYVFAKKGVRVESHSTVDLKDEGVFISDHWPVCTSLIWTY